MPLGQRGPLGKEGRSVCGVRGCAGCKAHALVPAAPCWSRSLSLPQCAAPAARTSPQSSWCAKCKVERQPGCQAWLVFRSACTSLPCGQTALLARLPGSRAGAIRACCMGQLFERARQLAGNNPIFTTYIEEQYNNFLLQVSWAARPPRPPYAAPMTACRCACPGHVYSHRGARACIAHSPWSRACLHA